MCSADSGSVVSKLSLMPVSHGEPAGAGLFPPPGCLGDRGAEGKLRVKAGAAADDMKAVPLQEPQSRDSGGDRSQPESAAGSTTVRSRYAWQSGMSNNRRTPVRLRSG